MDHERILLSPPHVTKDEVASIRQAIFHKYSS